MYTYRCTLVRVVDGDTVRLIIDVGFYMSRLEQSYRLLRINAPEMSTLEGKNAKIWLEAFLIGKSLTVMTQKSDNFGRFLAELYADNENVSDALVAAGQAHYQVYT